MQERLQKILSARGICSRRKAEEYIEKGLVTVNGEAATLGQKADPTKDRIEVDGTVLRERRDLLYYVLDKPVGVVTSNARLRDTKTVADLLPQHLRGKIYPVGRLDKDTSGLLLLTNDGPLAYRLTHPKFYHEKEYAVETVQPIPNGALQKLRKGITISGTKTKPARITRTGPSNFRIALTEGKNRQIRRMCQKVGSPVKTLRRIRITTLKEDATKKGTKPGSVRKLTEPEVKALLHSVGLG